MNENKKPYKEPETEIEIMNAQLRIARWAARKTMELEEKLEKLGRKNKSDKKRRR